MKSSVDWFPVFSTDIRPEVVVLVYGTLLDIPWYVSAAGRFAGVPRMYSIQHLIAPPVPPRVEGKSMHAVLRRLIGRRLRTATTNECRRVFATRRFALATRSVILWCETMAFHLREP